MEEEEESVRDKPTMPCTFEHARIQREHSTHLFMSRIRAFEEVSLTVDRSL